MATAKCINPMTTASSAVGLVSALIVGGIISGASLSLFGHSIAFASFVWLLASGSLVAGYLFGYQPALSRFEQYELALIGTSGSIPILVFALPRAGHEIAVQLVDLAATTGSVGALLFAGAYGYSMYLVTFRR